MSGCRIKQESYSARALDRATVMAFLLVWTPALGRGPVEKVYFIVVWKCWSGGIRVYLKYQPKGDYQTSSDIAINL